MELGSKEAYSTILRSRAGTGGSEQRRIAQNTARTAAAVEKASVSLAQLVGKKAEGKAMLPHMPAAY